MIGAGWGLAFWGGSPGGGEILLIFVVALLLFGARRLPEIARSLGRAFEEFRRSMREVHDEILKASDESPGPTAPPPREPPCDPDESRT